MQLLKTDRSRWRLSQVLHSHLKRNGLASNSGDKCKGSQRFSDKFRESEIPLHRKQIWHKQSQWSLSKPVGSERQGFDWQSSSTFWKQWRQRPWTWWGKQMVYKHTYLLSDVIIFYEKGKHQRKLCWVNKPSPLCHCGKWNPWLWTRWLRGQSEHTAPPSTRPPRGTDRITHHETEEGQPNNKHM